MAVEYKHPFIFEQIMDECMEQLCPISMLVDESGNFILHSFQIRTVSAHFYDLIECVLHRLLVIFIETDTHIHFEIRFITDLLLFSVHVVIDECMIDLFIIMILSGHPENG